MFFKKRVLNPLRPNPGRREKINLNFYFHTSLRCFKRLYEGLKGLHKTFSVQTPQRSVKIKITLIFILIKLSEMPGAGRINNECQQLY